MALARALVNEPVVVLLDEPMAALDQQLRHSMHGELKRLQQELHSTFVCVTHQQDEALMLSDRLAVLSAGSVLQIGTPQELYHTPHSTTVAGFIGLSNTVTGVIAGGEGEFCWVRTEGFPPFKVPRPVQPHSSELVTVMIRPEQLMIGCGPATGSSGNSIPGVLEKMAFNGNEVFYYVRLSTDVVWVVRMPSSVSRSRPLTIGQPVQVQWPTQEGITLPVHGEL